MMAIFEGAVRAGDLARYNQPALDCCVYVVNTLSYAYRFDPSKLQPYWMIWPDEPSGRVPAERTWGPVGAAIGTGIATSPVGSPVLASEPWIGGWYIVQGWTAIDADGCPAEGATGHTWLWWQSDNRVAQAQAMGLVVQSSRSKGIRWGGPTPWAYAAKTWTEPKLGQVRVARLVDLPG